MTSFQTFESQLMMVLELLRQDYEKGSSGDLPVLSTNRVSAITQKLKESLPEGSTSFEELVDALSQQILPYINRNTDPRYGAYITGSATPIGALAELIKGYYNQNGLKWNNSPIASELEQQVIQWVADFVQLPDHQEGILTSGGSMSNLMALHLALADKYPEREQHGLINAPKWTVYCSDQTHSSIERAMVFLGLGRAALRKIGVNEYFQIDIEKLEKQLETDLSNGYRPLAIIGNAGTTNTGSIDPLTDLGRLAKLYNCWYHVDGAYGLPARRLPELAERFAGVELADSVIINPHKWMYVPFEASCILTRAIPTAIHLTPDYLNSMSEEFRYESSIHSIELSKEFRALKVWMTIKYFGASQLTSFVRHDIEMTNYMAEILSKTGHWQIEQEHPLSILCFRYHNRDLSEATLDQINQKILLKIEGDGRIFLTGTRLYDHTYLRIYFGNPERKKSDVEYMVRQIEFLLEEVLADIANL